MGEKTELAEANGALDKAADGHSHESACLNCGTRLIGPYCQSCGQRAHVHRTIGAFWHDLLHGVLHFEGKIWRTLPLLAWKPGELTRRYIAGERASFVSPVALFLFSVFLMFAIYSVAGPDLRPDEFRNSRATVNAAIEEEKRDLRDLQEDRAQLVKAGAASADVAKVDESIAESREGIKALEVFVETGNIASSDSSAKKTGWRRLDSGIKKLNDNPALAVYKVQSNGYKFSWALIPISVPFVWLLFLHRRRYRQYGAYDHTVFVTYSITFVSLWLVALALLVLIPGTQSVRNLMLIVPAVHMFRQLRGAYALGWFSALWRTGALSLFAIAAITLFLLLLLLLGVMG